MRIIQTMALTALGLLTIAQGLLLHFMIPTNRALSPRFLSEVHFAIGGNDFAATILRRGQPTTVATTTITFGQETLQCDKQFWGLYYNNQRGQRLLPLDTITLNSLKQLDSNYEDLHIHGGLYTNCTGSNIDPASIVGQITFDHNGTQSYLIAGITPAYSQNSYQLPLTNSFQYFSETRPIGYIYDSNGGLGFVHGYTHDVVNDTHWIAIPYTEHQATIQQLANGSSINNIFSWFNQGIQGYNQAPVLLVPGQEPPATSTTISIQGITADTQGGADTISQQGLALPTTSFTTADITNQLRRRANQLCQGRQSAASLADPSNILCFDMDISLDLTQNTHANKTIIVKNADVVLQGSMDNTSAPLDIFIDNGNIVRDMHSPIDFDNQGRPTTNTSVAQGVLLKGNIFIDGLFVPAQGMTFSHKTYIHGKMMSLHSPSAPSLGQEQHITNKFGQSFVPFINILDVFAWRCNTDTQQGSDGSICGPHPYQTAPFVLIDRNYSSRLIP